MGKVRKEEAKKIAEVLKKNYLGTGRVKWHNGQYWFQIEGTSDVFPQGEWWSESKIKEVLKKQMINFKKIKRR